MSAPMYYNNDRRIDSALGLPLPHIHNNRTKLDSCMSEKNAMPHSAPWSQVNTRVEHNQLSAGELPEWTSGAYSRHTVHQLNGQCPILEDNLDIIESKLALSMPNPSISPAYVSPPIPASTSSAARALRASSSVDDSTICCGQCHVQFTGTYRRGNLARHVRHKHAQLKRDVVCTVDGCNKTFARQDARLKHARRHHPGLQADPVHRRQGYESHTMTSRSHQYKDTPRSKYSPGEGDARSVIEYPMASSASQCSGAELPYAIPTIASSEPDSSAAHMYRGSTIADHISFVGQWFPTSSQGPGFEGNISSEACPELHYDENSSLTSAHSAQTAFGRLRAAFDPEPDRQCLESYVTRWESIIKHMHDIHSDVYPLYAQALHDLHGMLETLSSSAAGPAQRKQAYQNHRPNNDQRSGTRGDAKLSLDAGTSAPIGQPTGHNQQKAVLGHGFATNICSENSQTPNGSKQVRITCPLYKFSIKHGGQRPCNGCTATSVAQVRHHCHRTKHPNFARYAKQCLRCYTDFIDEQAYRAHASRRCARRDQLRGDVVVVWVRLYLTYFPFAVKVPNPHDGDDSWLPAEVVAAARCRASPTDLPRTTAASSRPFLERNLQQRGDFRTASPAPVSAPLDPGALNTALETMIQDALTPIALQEHTPRHSGNTSQP
ncbi:hypothetical protein BDW02DRAFT_583714 [Decorospora gaudefroyi]|uniref:C2H2-type domain-containing protein n=1 Tax=Decorospora gaudefroyi TaxID=184978 RepID=A0A6A5JZZ9_9PLEO|nr:hypothetical protein BDW02DRAFT_583714 [Decorospora gaudefroyi]